MRSRIALIVGLALFWPLFRNSYFGVFFSSSTSFPWSSFILFGGILLSAILVCIFSYQVESYLARYRMVAPIVTCSTAIVLYLLIPFGSSVFVVGIAALFSAISVSILTISWGMVCVAQKKTQQDLLMVDIVISFFLSFIVASFSTFAPQFCAYVYPLFLPLSGFACMASGALHKGKVKISHNRHETKRDRRILLVIALFITLVSILVGLYSSGVATYTSDHNNQRYLFSLIFTLLLIPCMYLAVKRPQLHIVIWGAALLLVFAGVFLALAFNESWAEAGTDIVVIGRLTIWVLFWAMLINVAKTSHLNIVYLIGCYFLAFRGITSLMTDAISLLNQALLINEQDVSGITLAVTLILMVCAFVFIGLRESYGRESSVLAIQNLREDNAGNKTKASMEIAEQFKLTERESAVMQLVAQGYTMKKIAETLFISENTAKTHSKSLYRKLDCHSRQEVIDFVNDRIEGLTIAP